MHYICLYSLCLCGLHGFLMDVASYCTSILPLFLLSLLTWQSLFPLRDPLKAAFVGEMTSLLLSWQTNSVLVCLSILSDLSVALSPKAMVPTEEHLKYGFIFVKKAKSVLNTSRLSVSEVVNVH